MIPDYTASEREYIDSAKDDKTRELRTKIVENKRGAYQRTGVGNAVDYIKRAGGEYNGLAPKGTTFEDVAEAQINRTKDNLTHVNMMTQARKDGFDVSRGEDGKARLTYDKKNELEDGRQIDYIGADGVVKRREKNGAEYKNTGYEWNPSTQHKDGSPLKNEKPFRVKLTPEEQKELDVPIRWEDYDPRLRVWAEAHPEEFRQGRIAQILDRRIGPDGMDWRQHSLKWDAINRAWLNEGKSNDPVIEKYFQLHPEEFNRAPEPRKLKWYEQKGQ